MSQRSSLATKPASKSQIKRHQRPQKQPHRQQQQPQPPLLFSTQPFLKPGPYSTSLCTRSLNDCEFNNRTSLISKIYYDFLTVPQRLLFKVRLDRISLLLANEISFEFTLESYLREIMDPTIDPNSSEWKNSRTLQEEDIFLKRALALYDSSQDQPITRRYYVRFPKFRAVYVDSWGTMSIETQVWALSLVAVVTQNSLLLAYLLDPFPTCQHGQSIVPIACGDAIQRNFRGIDNFETKSSFRLFSNPTLNKNIQLAATFLETAQLDPEQVQRDLAYLLSFIEHQPQPQSQPQSQPQKANAYVIYRQKEQVRMMTLAVFLFKLSSLHFACFQKSPRPWIVPLLKQDPANITLLIHAGVQNTVQLKKEYFGFLDSREQSCVFEHALKLITPNPHTPSNQNLFRSLGGWDCIISGIFVDPLGVWGAIIEGGHGQMYDFLMTSLTSLTLTVDVGSTEEGTGAPPQSLPQQTPQKPALLNCFTQNPYEIIEKVLLSPAVNESLNRELWKEFAEDPNTGPIFQTILQLMPGQNTPNKHSDLIAQAQQTSTLVRFDHSLEDFKVPPTTPQAQITHSSTPQPSSPSQPQPQPQPQPLTSGIIEQRTTLLLGAQTPLHHHSRPPFPCSSPILRFALNILTLPPILDAIKAPCKRTGSERSSPSFSSDITAVHYENLTSAFFYNCSPTLLWPLSQLLPQTFPGQIDMDKWISPRFWVPGNWGSASFSQGSILPSLCSLFSLLHRHSSSHSSPFLMMHSMQTILDADLGSAGSALCTVSWSEPVIDLDLNQPVHLPLKNLCGFTKEIVHIPNERGRSNTAQQKRNQHQDQSNWCLKLPAFFALLAVGDLDFEQVLSLLTTATPAQYKFNHYYPPGPPGPCDPCDPHSPYDPHNLYDSGLLDGAGGPRQGRKNGEPGCFLNLGLVLDIADLPRPHHSFSKTAPIIPSQFSLLQLLVWFDSPRRTQKALEDVIEYFIRSVLDSFDDLILNPQIFPLEILPIDQSRIKGLDDANDNIYSLQSTHLW